MAVKLMDEMVPGQGLNMYILQLAVEVGTLFRDEDQQENKQISFKHKENRFYIKLFYQLSVFLSL